MNSGKRSIAVALATFGASVVGMLLQHIVPAQALTDFRGTVGAMVGLVTLLLALVLGLPVFTAFTVYTTQRDEAQGLGPVVMGSISRSNTMGPRLRPDAPVCRRRSVVGAPASSATKLGPRPPLEETRATLHGLSSYFDSLQPSTEAQRQLLTSARDNAKKFAEMQMLMARQLANPIPPYVLVVVVCCGPRALSRQRPRRDAECRYGRRAFGRGDRHRQRDLSDPRTEFALHRRRSTVVRRPRPAAAGSGRREREGGGVTPRPPSRRKLRRRGVWVDPPHTPSCPSSG